MPAARPARAIVLVAAGLLVAIAVWLFGLWYFSPWVAHNDFAILRLRLERVLDGDPGLVGAYSRLDVFHPGPALEWLFAVPYWASGRRAAALPATALVLNLAWVALALTIAWRRRSAWIGSVTAAGLAVLLIALRDQLDSPWNPHLAVLPLFVATAATVLVLDGSRRAWIVAVGAASFAAQLHASAALVAGALFVAVVAGEWRADDGRRWWRSFALGAVLWIGPIVDLFHGTDANLVRIVTTDGGDRLGLLDGWGALARILWLPSILDGAAADPTASLLSGFGLWWLLGVAAVVVVGVVRCVGPMRHVAAVAAAGLVAASVSVVAFFEPPYAYLFAPLQSSAAFAFVAAVAVVVRLTTGRSMLPERAGTIAVGVAAVACVVSVAATSRHDHESAARREMAIDRAVGDHLEEHPGWREVDVVGLDLVAANPVAEVAEILVRRGRVPRSNDPTLDLDPLAPGVPVYVVAMGAGLDCLLDAGADPLTEGRVPSVDAPVAVFAFDVDRVGLLTACAPEFADIEL